MNVEIPLGPEETAELEPSESEQGGRVVSGISPFAVPRGAFVEGPQIGLVQRIRFDYAGGEEAVALERLDDRTDPEVWIHTSPHTRKIIILDLSSPVDAQGLRQIGSRLSTRATNVAPRAKRFSYMMIAGLLKKWAELIVPPDDAGEH